MVELPGGSLVGLSVLCLVIGIVLGRSGSFMKRMGNLHAAAHGGHGEATATATGGHADQRVQTVVVVDRDGVPRVDGFYDLDAMESLGVDRTHSELGGSSAVGELVEGDEDVLLVEPSAARRPAFPRVLP